MKSTMFLIKFAIAAAVVPENEDSTLIPSNKESANEPAVQFASKFENSRRYGESIGSWGDDGIKQISPMNQWNLPNQWGQNSQWGQGGWNNQWNNNGWNTGGQWINGQWRRNSAQTNNLKAAAAVIAGFAAVIF